VGIPTEATIALESDDPEFVDFRKNTPREQIDKYFKTIVCDGCHQLCALMPRQLLCCFNLPGMKDISMKRQC
jgi:hypothetical protein